MNIDKLHMANLVVEVIDEIIWTPYYVLYVLWSSRF